MKKLALALLFCGVAQAVSAASWVTAGFPTSRQFIAFFDLDSVRRVGDTVTVWNRWVYEKPFNKSYSVLMHQTRYHCVNRTAEVLASVNYDNEGQASRMFGPQSPDVVIPGSFGEQLFNAYCNPDFPSAIDRASEVVSGPDAAAKAVFGTDEWQEIGKKSK